MRRYPWYVSAHTNAVLTTPRTRGTHFLWSPTQTTCSTVASMSPAAGLTLCTPRGYRLPYRPSSPPSPTRAPTSSSRNRPAPRLRRATSCSISSTTRAAGAPSTHTAPRTACSASGYFTTLVSSPRPRPRPPGAGAPLPPSPSARRG